MCLSWGLFYRLTLIRYSKLPFSSIPSRTARPRTPWAAARMWGRGPKRCRLTSVASPGSCVVPFSIWMTTSTGRLRLPCWAGVARQRAESAKLLALGSLEIDDSPTRAVAYALKSLELADTDEARLFALEALQRGPTAFTSDYGALTGQAVAANVP